MSSFQEMSDLRRLTDPAILEARMNKEYRPVAVAVIADRRDRVLLVQSQKNPDDWGLPQGGIEPDEDLIAALFREIKEETGIDEDRLEFAGYVGMTDLDDEAGRKDKRGYAKGKSCCTTSPSWRAIDGKIRTGSPGPWRRPGRKDAT